MIGRGSLGIVAALAVLVACGDATPSADPSASEPARAVSAERGKVLFNTSCASCHGVGAVGTGQGPSFLNDVYVPSHHADGAFLVAVTRGAAQHHWRFGPMPPIGGVTAEDVADIVAYVRGLQREAGLIE